MVLAFAALRLTVQVSRLVAGGPEVFGAVDLAFRHAEVVRWFAGERVYGALDTAVYPPATYALLWPLLGWLDFPAARLLWAASGVAALGALAFLTAHGAGDLRDRTLLALLPCAFYATGVTLAAGQMLVHLLPAVLGATLLASGSKGGGWTTQGIGRDAAAAALFVAALAKPSATLPFVWLVLLPPRGARRALLVGSGYAAVTFIACAFRPSALVEYLGAGLRTARGVAASSGYGHLGVWLSGLGLEAWLPVASLVLLVGLGAWVSRHRDADPWVLLGVSAVVARVWTYHQVYDDVLILFAAAAAYRVARNAAEPALRRPAAFAFACAAAAGLAPTRLYALPAPWPLLLFELPQMLAWALLLAALAPPFPLWGEAAGRSTARGREAGAA